MKTSRTRKSKITLRDGLFTDISICKLTEMLFSYDCVLTYCYVIMDKGITFEKVYAKTHRFIRQKKLLLPKSTARFPAKKRWHFPPPPGCLGIPLPLPQSLFGRTYGRTLTSQPKFPASMGYQIFLSMLLFGALSARMLRYRVKTYN